ncbi:helix-turn-helix domain-containing protein [Bdellovibrio sp. BCCA]|uniref:helix-turn-helix domain-containing protein n=1 Tax=Bdellovibrio sp. BCCA TaxID=3136281 RepID=UPI0030F300CC
MSLTKSLRRILDDRKITVAQIARQSGVPAKTIYHWLSGQQPRKMEHLFRLCDTLNISVEELYGRQRKNPTKNILPKEVLLQELNAGVYEVILRPLKMTEGP